MFTKRKFISTAILATIVSTAGIAPAFADQGGNDPIPGIDIIIKRDPASQPIDPFSLSNSELGEINRLKGDDRAEFVMKVIADRIGEREEFLQAGTRALQRHMCSDCEVKDEIEIDFRAGEFVYSISLKFDGVEGESQ